MPNVTTLEKYSFENRLYDFAFQFQPELVGGQTLSSPSVTQILAVSIATGATVVDAALVIGTPVVSGTIVQVRISAGTPNVAYTLRCTVTTSGGSTLECDGILIVD